MKENKLTMSMGTEFFDNHPIDKNQVYRICKMRENVVLLT